MIDADEIEVASETIPQPSGLELEIESLLTDTLNTTAVLRAAKLPGGQPFEVASTFLCNARTFERHGKHELAKRQLVAARNVLAGGKAE